MTRIGLYFAASWCSACKEFTPKLVKAYNDIIKNDPDFIEIWLIPIENSKEKFENYLKTHPFRYIPLDDPRINEYKLMFNVETIPTLIIVDRDYDRCIDLDGVTSVSNGDDLLEKWK